MTFQVARTIVQQRTDVLLPYARNSRTHSEAQVAQIAASIREFGFTNPVLVDGDNGIVAGHGRVMAAKQLGPAEVPTISVGWLTEGQRRAYVIADNQLALTAGWDEAVLAQEVAWLQGENFNTDLLGFDADFLDGLLAEQDATSTGLTDQDDAPAVQVNAITQPGDVWVMGKHRLMCGDCRSSGDVSMVMGGGQINVAITSPPYASQRTYDEASGFKPIPEDEYVDWYKEVAANIMANLADDGSYFCNIKPAAENLDTHLYVFDLVIAHARSWGWHFATEFCWERNGIPKQVVRRFKNQFEPIYQFVKNDWKMRPDAVRHESKSVPIARGKGAGNTSWAAHQGGDSFRMSGKQCEAGFEWFGDNIQAGMAYPGNRLPTFASTHEALGHSAAFPVGLPQFFIEAYSDAGDSVFDPFMGSGSTLMAAEKTGRCAFGTEISPIYCDVIVRRWQSVTGKRAVLESTGQPFPESPATEDAATA